MLNKILSQLIPYCVKDMEAKDLASVGSNQLSSLTSIAYPQEARETNDILSKIVVKKKPNPTNDHLKFDSNYRYAKIELPIMIALGG